MQGKPQTPGTSVVGHAQNCIPCKPAVTSVALFRLQWVPLRVIILLSLRALPAKAVEQAWATYRTSANQRPSFWSWPGFDLHQRQQRKSQPQRKVFLPSFQSRPETMTCPFCKKVFANRSNLVRHIQRKRQQETNGSAPRNHLHSQGRCVCVQCGYRCHRIADLRKHLSRAHNAIFRFERIDFENYSDVCWTPPKHTYMHTYIQECMKADSLSTIHTLVIHYTAFEVWKEDQEEIEDCFYSKRTGTKTDRKSEVTIQYFQCNRCGELKSTAKENENWKNKLHVAPLGVFECVFVRVCGW